MKSLKLALLLAMSVGSAFSTSCSTTKGFGQDLQKLGNKLENEAEATGGTAPTYTAPSHVPPAY
jgi:predicted small secreted protein